MSDEIGIVCDVWTIYGIEPYLIRAERCASDDVVICVELFQNPSRGISGIGKRN